MDKENEAPSPSAQSPGKYTLTYLSIDSDAVLQVELRLLQCSSCIFIDMRQEDFRRPHPLGENGAAPLPLRPAEDHQQHLIHRQAQQQQQQHHCPAESQQQQQHHPNRPTEEVVTTVRVQIGKFYQSRVACFTRISRYPYDVQSSQQAAQSLYYAGGRVFVPGSSFLSALFHCINDAHVVPRCALRSTCPGGRPESSQLLFSIISTPVAFAPGWRARVRVNYKLSDTACPRAGLLPEVPHPLQQGSQTRGSRATRGCSSTLASAWLPARSPNQCVCLCLAH